MEKINYKPNSSEAKKLFFSQKSRIIRKELIDNALCSHAGHIAPSLSCVDILVALYYNVMNISKENWEERDRFILSKGHGCYGLYTILNDLKLIPDEQWKNFYTDNSRLSGCLERIKEYGLEASTGSLGHGLPIATGIAFGAKKQNLNYKVYCLVGDGEMQEGSMWEAVQFAVKYELSNLTIIVDQNNLQAMDYLDNILTPKGKEDDIKIKLEAFGCHTISCDGHKPYELSLEINKLNEDKSITAPKAIIAKTVKGRGLLCMENIAKFHFRLPTPEEMEMGKRYE